MAKEKTVRDEIIETLRQVKSGYQRSITESDVVKVVSFFINKFSDGSHNWISVQDELPECENSVLSISEDVLCIMDNQLIVMGAYFAKSDVWIHRETGDRIIVTHWQPKPKLPKN